MLNPSHGAPVTTGLGGQLDGLVVGALDRVGIVGQRLRERLVKDLKAKVVLRGGHDAVEVIGAPGTGKNKVVEAVHEIGRSVFGRTGPLHRLRLDEPSGWQADRAEAAVDRVISQARGGTLVLERFDALRPEDRGPVARVMRDKAQSGDAIVLAMSHRDPEAGTLDTRPATSIRLKPLHERDEDIWELADHFFASMVEDGALSADLCQGFSRQAKADLAEVVKETGLASVRKMRDIVRDIVFETIAEGDLPLKLTSEHVRPYLERCFGQTEDARRKRDAALIASQFEAPEVTGSKSLIAQLAQTHGVSAELIQREVEVLRELVDSIDGVPKSYRNIMTKAEDIQRAAMWVLTGASTQADFRRYFGEEGFMRPTKSVAWAFYNRVFQRDV
ncbi:MAG: hypothetical protein IT385_20950 [Deltaproteobacteria bacterium]|nr:hypothetical protein [Deltaproteobacteria bacterium]